MSNHIPLTFALRSLAEKDLTGTEAGVDSERAFQVIRQIDLVPTISILLGLPIPYANIGGLVPSLLPSPNHSKDQSTPQIALALALNAAQVWRYFTVYSQTANKLPSMPELESLLTSAVSAYKKALEHDDGHDSIASREACGKFKVFLMEAAELGIRVWTRFDTVGMIVGGSILFASVLLVSWRLVRFALELNSTLPRDQRLEVVISAVFMLFYCLLLTFSNSYIDAEQHIGTFAQAVICIALCGRMSSAPLRPKNGGKLSVAAPWLPLVIPICSRLGELFVSGHGLDPSLKIHGAHHPAVFLSSLTALVLVRAYVHRKQRAASLIHVCVDVAILLLLALAWAEKRSSDTARNGYVMCRMALALSAVGILLSVLDVVSSNKTSSISQNVSGRVSILLFRLLAAIMTVTGPSSATSVVLFVIQAFVLQRLAEQSGQLEVRAMNSVNILRHLLSEQCLTNDPFWASGFCTRLGSLVEIGDSTHVLLDQPFLCIQSFAVLGGICGNGSVLLCYRRCITLSQHVWLGDCRFTCRVHICVSDATTVSVEDVFLLPVVGNPWIVCICEYLQAAPNGVGDLCPTLHFFRHLPCTELRGTGGSISIYNIR